MIVFKPCVATKANVRADNIHNGQLILTLDTGEIFLDFNGSRTPIASQSETGNLLTVSEDGFFVIDDANRIGLKLDENGLDAVALSSHLLSLIPRVVAESYSETEYPEV